MNNYREDVDEMFDAIRSKYCPIICQKKMCFKLCNRVIRFAIYQIQVDLDEKKNLNTNELMLMGIIPKRSADNHPEH